MSTRVDRSSYNSLVRRIINLPLSILGGVSRAVGQGITLMGGGRRHHPPVHFQQPHEAPVIPEEWHFITSFEQQYGFSHPFFYACKFFEALKMAEAESKFLFVYLHSPDHPYTAPFCSGTLCSELVVQFLDANFVSWGALSNRGDGAQMTSTLRATAFPFCALIMPASDDSIAVLQQVEGPVSPGELVEILQRTIEEQHLASTLARTAEAEKRNANRQLREEQDAAYQAALQLDREKERFRELVIEEADQVKTQVEAQKKANTEKPMRSAMTKQPGSKVKETTKETEWKGTVTHGKDPLITQIQIRFPNGERKEQIFLCTDKIQSIYRYIDSQDLPGIGSYRLIGNYPRKVYGFEQMGMTLKDAGLHPRASLFLELV